MQQEGEQVLTSKDRAKKKCNDKYVVYSPDDDISSDEDDDSYDGPEQPVDEDDTSMCSANSIHVHR